MILFATIYESIWRSGFKGLLFCNLNSFRHRILDLCTYQSTCLVISGYHFQEYFFEIQNASLQNVFIDWNAIFFVLNLAMTEANYIRSISKKKTIHFDLALILILELAKRDENWALNLNFGISMKSREIQSIALNADDFCMLC